MMKPKPRRKPKKSTAFPAEKSAAAIVVFSLRKPLRTLVSKLREKSEGGKTLTKNRQIDALSVITRAPAHQDAVSRLIGNSPSTMLFLEFLISQASEHGKVSKKDFFARTIEEVCILVEGYQAGLAQGLDVGEHIMGIPESEEDAQALWDRLAQEPSPEKEAS